MQPVTGLSESWRAAWELVGNPAVQSVLLNGSVAFGMCAFLTPLAIRGARSLGWVARPSEDRWHDGASVALAGGVAIAAATLVALVVGGLLGSVEWPVAAAAALLFGVGLADDRRGLSPRLKLLAQVGAATLTVYGGLVFWASGPFWLSAPLTFLWVIGTTNAFNLIDGMDGLAAGIAAIAGSALALIAAYEGMPSLAGIAAALAAASGGFLLYNFYPARIFMGDGGSLFLGYALGALAIAVQNGGPGAAQPGAVLVPTVVLAVPLFDVAFVTVMRVANGRPIAQGGTDHSMHRLASLGLSERQTVLFLYGVSAAFGGIALLLYSEAVLLFVAVVLTAVGALVVLGSHISTADVYPRVSKARAGPFQATSFQATDGQAVDARAASSLAGGPEEDPSQEGWPLGGDREGVLSKTHSPAVPQTLTARLGAVMQALVGIEWKRAGGLLADVFVILGAFLMAHALRFPGGMPLAYQEVMLEVLPLVAGGKVAIFYLTGVYHRIWPHAGTPEMVHLLKAVAWSSALTFAGLHAFYPGEVVSASALVTDLMLTVGGVGATRFGFRALRQFIIHKQRAGERVIILGVGSEGILALRALGMPDVEEEFHVVGFVDNYAPYHGHQVKGVPVLGGVNDLRAICREKEADGVIINTVGCSKEKVESICRRVERDGRDCYRVTIGLEMMEGEAGAPKSHEGERGVGEESVGRGLPATVRTRQ